MRLKEQTAAFRPPSRPPPLAAPAGAAPAGAAPGGAPAGLKKPAWLKARIPSGEKYHKIKSMARQLGLATVCEEARCPNMGECWPAGTATLMLMGDLCSRGCRFCHVKTGNPKGRLDPLEPEKTAFAARYLALSYIVLTCVNRDDLPDQGAGHIARAIDQVRRQSPSILVEILAPDFQGHEELIDTVCQARPHVFAHNVETVERLTPSVRDPRAGFRQSVEALSFVKGRYPDIVTKTSLMLGLGERDEEVLQTLKILRGAGCDVVTFGQYLQPSWRHLPAQSYIAPQKFDEWGRKALDLGFLYAPSGPLVRSSYRAGEFFMEAMLKNRKAASAGMSNAPQALPAPAGKNPASAGNVPAGNSPAGNSPAGPAGAAQRGQDEGQNGGQNGG